MPTKTSTKPRKPAPPRSKLRGLCSKLLEHTFLLGEKFVSREKNSLGTEIKNTAIQIMRTAIAIDSYHYRNHRLELYLKIDADLKLLCELIPIAYYRRCISSTNRDAWIRMVLDIDNLAMSQVLKIDKENKAKAEAESEDTQE
jgi:hypothetical protein